MSAAARNPVPGLRSPREEVQGLVYFGRMVDKLRLEQAGKLPTDYHENMGKGFDASCCDFLGVKYESLRERVQKGGSDEEVLAWCEENGKKRDASERAVWSAYLAKRGWRDDLSQRLIFRKQEAGWERRDEIQTFFDYIDADEGRGERDPIANPKTTGHSVRMKSILLSLLALVTLVPLPAMAVSSMEERIDKTIEVLEQYGKAQGDSIPRQVFHDAKGLAVLWVIKAGFIVAGEGGDGLVVIRKGKKWSHPSAVSAAGAGVGFQAGGSSQDYVLLLNTENAVKQFSQKGNYTSSAEVEGTAGPVGRELSAGVATVNAPVYTYSFTKGLFGGVSLSGLGYASADDTNENFYGERLDPREILEGKVKKTPEAVKRLWKVLEELDKKSKIEGKTPTQNKKK